MLKAFLAFVYEKKLLPIPTQGLTLLAVSGGVDSVVMSHLFHKAGLSFAMVHCNFRLRGSASYQDEVLVQTLAQHYGVACYIQSFDVLAYAREKHLSIQMAARELRYSWFQELCEKHGFEKVATAHHWNDSLETVLLNLTKGTGIAGLHGILPAQGRYIRPLLFADKNMLLAYAQSQKLAWREDSSNRQDHYQRNLIRNKVVPLLKTINPNLEATFGLTVERLSQVEALLEEHAATLRQHILRQQGEEYYVAIHTVQGKAWAPVVVLELLKPFGFKFLQLKKLLSRAYPSGTMIQSTSHRLYVDRAQWIITPRTEQSPKSYIIDTTTKSLTLPYSTLQCTHVPRSQYKLVTDKAVAALDQALLKFPLVVRNWQQGDFFYPLGMQQRKKLSDFLIDTKVPMPMKARVLVVTSGGALVWVVGHRVDDRFKVTDNTQQVYALRLIPQL